MSFILMIIQTPTIPPHMPGLVSISENKQTNTQQPYFPVYGDFYSFLAMVNVFSILKHFNTFSLTVGELLRSWTYYYSEVKNTNNER